MANQNITLYMLPGTCAVVPHILLHQARLEFDLSPVSRDSLATDFSSTNPKHQVPVLDIDGELITENPAIAQAINQIAPEAKLFGETPLQFIRVCEWLNYFSASIHAQAWGPYQRPQRFTDDKEAEAGISAVSKRKLLDRLALIESRLPEDGWILGTKEMTAADAYLLPFYEWVTGRMKYDVDSEFPKWARLVQRLKGLESVSRTLEEIEKIREEMGHGARVV